MINSREKGKKGEREVAKLLSDRGYKCRRGQQFNGLDGEDVVGLDYMHIEVKRVQNLNLYDAYLQAKRDAKEKKPLVFHRKNNQRWLVSMDFDTFIEFLTIFKQVVCNRFYFRVF